VSLRENARAAHQKTVAGLSMWGLLKGRQPEQSGEGGWRAPAKGAHPRRASEARGRLSTGHDQPFRAESPGDARLRHKQRDHHAALDGELSSGFTSRRRSAGKNHQHLPTFTPRIQPRRCQFRIVLWLTRNGAAASRARTMGSGSVPCVGCIGVLIFPKSAQSASACAMPCGSAARRERTKYQRALACAGLPHLAASLPNPLFEAGRPRRVHGIRTHQVGVVRKNFARRTDGPGA